MKWKTFTPEELENLKESPYIRSATAKMLRFTIAFKEEFWKKYSAGEEPRTILSEMGLDPDVLGTPRIRGIIQHLREGAESGEGFREVRQRNIVDTNSDHLPPSKALIHIQHEIAYLKQELEFPKTIAADREARRKCPFKGNPYSRSATVPGMQPVLGISAEKTPPS